MQRLLAILCILGSIGMTATAQAQTIQRNYGTTGGTGGSPYGTSGYGASPYGSGTTYGGTQTPFGSQANPAGTAFTGQTPSTPGNDNTAAPAAADPSSADYQRVMNSVNSASSDTDNPNAAAGNTATPPVATSANSLATPPSESSAYNSPLGAPIGGPTGASGLPGSNGMLTSPSGTTGLGEYNRSPYAAGQAASSANPAPGPATPVYSGTNTGQ